MRCGEAIAHLLERYGVDTVFGIPGVHTLEYYRGFAGSGIRTVLTRHEQGAGFMADGYARATGRPGVCCVISGPGVTNVTTPMGQAYSDSIPMLVLASVNRTESLGKGWGELHESSDQLAAARPLAGIAAGAAHPGDVADFLRRAFAMFASERPRPAFLQVPIDVLDEETAGGWEVAPRPGQPGPDPVAIEAAARSLRSANRPGILLGGGTVDAAEPIRRLVRQLGAPVVTTIAGKGVVPESDPLSLGSTLPLPAVQRWLSNRDVILAIGSEIAETDLWGHALSLRGRLIRVDLDPKQLAGPFPSEVPIVSGAAQFANALLACFQEDKTKAPYHDGQREAGELRAAIRESQEKARVGRHAVLETMRAALPAETRIYTDMTQIAYTGNTVYPVDLPRRWFHPSGYGTLGYALPAAIGGAFGDPHTPTVALVGDAGLLFGVQEMATAAELGLPLTVILWNNDALGQIRQNMVDRGIPPISVEARNPDFQALARSFGWQTSAPTSLAALERDLHRAGAQSGPLLVEVRERCFTAA